MTLLVAILVVAALLGGFLLLTAAERKSGRRVLAGARSALDTRAENARAFLRRADLGAVVFHGIRALGEYLVRAFVHGILVAVRAVERTLTQVARNMRQREEMLMSSRTFLSAWLERAKRRISRKKEDAIE